MAAPGGVVTRHLRHLAKAADRGAQTASERVFLICPVSSPRVEKIPACEQLNPAVCVSPLTVYNVPQSRGVACVISIVELPETVYFFADTTGPMRVEDTGHVINTLSEVDCVPLAAVSLLLRSC